MVTDNYSQAQPRFSTCAACARPDVPVFYTMLHGWICEGCCEATRVKDDGRYNRPIKIF